MDELTTFEGLVALRAFRQSVGAIPRRAEEERDRMLAENAARLRWRMRSERKRGGPRRTRHAA